MKTQKEQFQIYIPYIVKSECWVWQINITHNCQEWLGESKKSRAVYSMCVFFYQIGRKAPIDLRRILIIFTKLDMCVGVWIWVTVMKVKQSCSAPWPTCERSPSPHPRVYSTSPALAHCHFCHLWFSSCLYLLWAFYFCLVILCSIAYLKWSCSSAKGAREAEPAGHPWDTWNYYTTRSMHAEIGHWSFHGLKRKLIKMLYLSISRPPSQLS